MFSNPRTAQFKTSMIIMNYVPIKNYLWLYPLFSDTPNLFRCLEGPQPNCSHNPKHPVSNVGPLSICKLKSRTHGSTGHGRNLASSNKKIRKLSSMDGAEHWSAWINPPQFPCSLASLRQWSRWGRSCRTSGGVLKSTGSVPNWNLISQNS